MLALIRKKGLPIPMLQYVVKDGDRFVARLHLAYPEARVGLEADSFEFHDRRDTFDDERARGNALQALGWIVLRITSVHLERDPESVAEWIGRALEERRT